MEFNEWLKVCESSGEAINKPERAYAEGVKLIKDFNKEHFIGLYLNSKNQIIHSEVIAIGTLNSSVLHPREVFKPAFVHSANSVILLHNHPSGSVKPSPEDINVTARLKEAGDLLNIPVLDHVIMGNNKYYSFENEGKV